MKNKSTNNLPSTTQKIQWLFSGRKRWRAKQENNVLKAIIRRTNPKDSFMANKCVQYVQSSLIEKGQEENVYTYTSQSKRASDNQPKFEWSGNRVQILSSELTYSPMTETRDILIVYQVTIKNKTSGCYEFNVAVLRYRKIMKMVIAVH